jgi:phenylpyruvate tautomerase PptA (4-oxalocrotonate tautomerase family)
MAFLEQQVGAPLLHRTIQVTKEGSGPGRPSVSAEERAALIAGVSQLLLDILQKPLDATFVVIEASWRTGAGVG